MRKSKVCVVVPMLLVAVMVTTEKLKVVGVPEMVAVPLVLALKVNPLGRAPVSASVAVGEPVVVTVKVEALPTVGVTRELLVNFGGVPMVMVRACVTEPLALVAVRVSVEVPAVVGVPVMVAVPSPLLVKRTPVGTVPVSVMAAVGEPVVVTVKENAVPTTPVAEPALVNFGATGAAVTVNP